MFLLFVLTLNNWLSPVCVVYAVVWRARAMCVRAQVDEWMDFPSLVTYYNIVHQLTCKWAAANGKSVKRKASS